MAYYRDLWNEGNQREDQFLDVFAEFDFVCVDDTCNYFCPECRNMLKCTVYSDFKDEWESFYM